MKSETIHVHVFLYEQDLYGGESVLSTVEFQQTDEDHRRQFRCVALFFSKDLNRQDFSKALQFDVFRKYFVFCSLFKSLCCSLLEMKLTDFFGPARRLIGPRKSMNDDKHNSL